MPEGHLHFGIANDYNNSGYGADENYAWVKPKYSPANICFSVLKEHSVAN